MKFIPAAVCLLVLVVVPQLSRSEDVEDVKRLLLQELNKEEVDPKALDELNQRFKRALKAKREAEAEVERARTAVAAEDPAAIDAAVAKLKEQATPKEAEEAEQEERWDPRLAFSLGAAYLDPFEIEEETDSSNVTTARLKKGDADIRAAAELSWRDRWSWRPSADAACNQLAIWTPGERCDGGGFPLDFEARAGVILKSSGDADGSSISGASGEAWGTLIAGYPLWAVQSSGGTRYSFGPEVSIGYVSDEGAKDLHSTYILGGSLAWSSPTLFGGALDKREGSRRSEGLLRLGFAHAEVPKLIGDTRQVELEHEFPEFEGNWGGALDVEFNVPVGDTSYLQLRSSFLTGFDPNPWALYFGWVTPLNEQFVLKILPGAVADLAGISDGKKSKSSDPDAKTDARDGGTDEEPE